MCDKARQNTLSEKKNPASDSQKPGFVWDVLDSNQ